MRFHVFATTILLAQFFTVAWAEDAPKGPPNESKKVSAEEVNRLIEQLGDVNYNRRMQAKKELEAIGDAALDSLKKVAGTSEDPEIRSAAAEITETIQRNFQLVKVFGKHGNRVNGVAITGDGKRALSGSWDGLVRYWNLETGELIGELKGHGIYVMFVAFSADGKRALTSAGDRTMRLWDLESLTELRAFRHPQGVADVAISPDGKKAVSAGLDGRARIWNLESGEQLLELEAVKRARNWTVAFTPDGKQVVTGGGNTFDPAGEDVAALRLWDAETGKKMLEFDGHTGDIRRVVVSADGKQLLSGSFDGTMRLWEIARGKEVKRFEGPGNFVESVAFLPDGKRVICCYGPKGAGATYDNDPSCSLRIWDIASAKELLQYKGHTAPILTLALSTDGSLLVSGSADNTMRLWRVPK